MWSPRPGREPIWIKARYERHQNFCYECGRIGHDMRSCLYEKKEEVEEERRYGGWLSAQADRPIEGIERECKKGWEVGMEKGNNEKESTKEGKTNKNLIEEIRDRGRAEQHGKNDSKEAVEDEGRNKKENRTTKGVTIVSTGVRTNKKKEVENKGEDRKSDASERNSTDTPIIEEDLSRAIVVYGAQSPISEILRGMRKIQLKRDRDEEEEQVTVKRRRIEFSSIEEGEGALMMNPQGKERKKYVRKKSLVGKKDSKRRTVKRRNEMQDIRGALKEAGVGERELENQRQSEADAMKQQEKGAAGEGGWPITATMQK